MANPGCNLTLAPKSILLWYFLLPRTNQIVWGGRDSLNYLENRPLPGHCALSTKPLAFPLGPRGLWQSTWPRQREGSVGVRWVVWWRLLDLLPLLAPSTASSARVIVDAQKWTNDCKKQVLGREKEMCPDPGLQPACCRLWPCWILANKIIIWPSLKWAESDKDEPASLELELEF